MGEAGIVNTRLLNEALLLKWAWRIYNHHEGGACCKLLEQKYLTRRPFAIAKNRGGSQFWQGVIKVKDKLKRGLKIQVNDEENTLFWEDVWLDEIPLKLAFPQLYEYCRNKLVNKCFKEGEWVMDFKRSLLPAEASAWISLLTKLEGVKLSRLKDRAIWVLEKSGVYSVKSMYRNLTHRGVINKRMRELWKSKCP